MKTEPTIILSRDGKHKGKILDCDENEPCDMEGCRGKMIGIKWSDGSITFACSQGIKTIDKKHSQIL